ncbi:MAG: hypothetical protein RL681_424 [Candidatus Parcubacteria bacterium]|jgi:hypothetical protein
MVVINEWLSNPAGSDAQGEWIELWNGGPGAVDLSGWKLTTDSGKGYALNGVRVAEGEYVVLQRTTTHLTLRNSDGSVTLTDAEGRVADRTAFVGVAPEGLSANRDVSGRTIFAKPTPGAPNTKPTLALIGSASPTIQPPRQPISGLTEAVLLGTSCGIALVVAVLFIMKRNYGLSELFLGAH